MYVCVCVCACACVRACVYVCVRVLCLHACVSECVRACVRAYVLSSILSCHGRYINAVSQLTFSIVTMLNILKETVRACVQRKTLFVRHMSSSASS